MNTFQDAPKAVRIAIGQLRQWLNEDRNCTPMVTNEELWLWLKESYEIDNRTN